MCTFPDAKLDAYKSEVDGDAAKLEVFRDCFEQMAVKYCEYVAIVITVFQLGWEKGRVQKKLGTI